MGWGLPPSWMPGNLTINIRIEMWKCASDLTGNRHWVIFSLAGEGKYVPFYGRLFFRDLWLHGKKSYIYEKQNKKKNIVVVYFDTGASGLCSSPSKSYLVISSIWVLIHLACRCALRNCLVPEETHRRQGEMGKYLFSRESGHSH